MKGVNKITLNEATMIEIVQEWCDRRFPTADHVKVIRFKAATSYGSEYEITLCDKSETPNE